MTHGTDPHSRAADAVHEHRPVEAQYVRQGRRGTHVLWILLISLAMAVLAVWGSWVLFFSGDLAATEPHNARQAADARAFEAPDGSAPLQTPAQDPTAAERGSLPGGQQAPGSVVSQPGDVQAQQMGVTQRQGGDGQTKN